MAPAWTTEPTFDRPPRHPSHSSHSCLSPLTTQKKKGSLITFADTTSRISPRLLVIPHVLTTISPQHPVASQHPYPDEDGSLRLRFELPRSIFLHHFTVAPFLFATAFHHPPSAFHDNRLATPTTRPQPAVVVFRCASPTTLGAFRSVAKPG